MKEINDEIKLTLNLMQADIDDGAHGELQSHLYSLLEMKRNELQKRLVERAWSEPTLGIDKAKPLTSDELMAGGWWIDEAGSQSLLELFRVYGVITGVAIGCFDVSVCDTCLISSRDYGRDLSGFKQIHRIGNEFYWGEK